MKSVPTRAVNVVVISSTAFSALSVLIFLGYALARFALAAPASLLRQIVLAGTVAGIVAQVFQFLTVFLVLVAWFAVKTMPKSLREMVILVLCLIPFMPLIILVVVGIVYVAIRVSKSAPQHRAALEATQKDVFIDAASVLAGQFEVNPAAPPLIGAVPGAPVVPPTGANAASAAPTLSQAGSAPAGAAPTATAHTGATPIAHHTSVHSVVKQVVGPVTSESLKRTPAAMLGSFVLVAAVAVASVGATTALLSSNTLKVTGTTKEYPLPAGLFPEQIVRGSNGRNWVTYYILIPSETSAPDEYAGLLSAQGTLTQFDSCSGLSSHCFNGGGLFHSATLGADGNLWVAAACSALQVTPAGAFADYPVASPCDSTVGITSASDGTLWYLATPSAGSGQYFLGSMSTGGAGANTYPAVVPSSGYIPTTMAAGAAGSLWLGASDGTGKGNALIDSVSLSGAVKQFTIPGTSGSSQSALAIGGIAWGRDGALWFTLPLLGKIGRITPAGAITTFALPTQNLAPYNITLGPDGNMWFTEANNQVGWITPSGAVGQVSVPGGSVTYIINGGDGSLWTFVATGTASNAQYNLARITP